MSRRRRPNKHLHENPPAEQILTQQLSRVQLRLAPLVAIPDLLNTDADGVLDALARWEPSTGARDPDLVRLMEGFYGVGAYGGIGIGGEEGEDEDAGEIEDNVDENGELGDEEEDDDDDAPTFLTGTASLTLSNVPLDVNAIGDFLQVADENEEGEDPDAEEELEPIGNAGGSNTDEMETLPLTLWVMDRSEGG